MGDFPPKSWAIRCPRSPCAGQRMAGRGLAPATAAQSECHDPGHGHARGLAGGAHCAVQGCGRCARLCRVLIPTPVPQGPGAWRAIRVPRRCCTGTTCTARCGSKAWWRPRRSPIARPTLPPARESRIGAWASAQSRPVSSREALMAQVKEATARFVTGEVPRPSFWGGYRLWPKPSNCGSRARPASMIGPAGPAPWDGRRMAACSPDRGRSSDCSLEPKRRLPAGRDLSISAGDRRLVTALNVSFAPVEFVAILGVTAAASP